MRGHVESVEQTSVNLINERHDFYSEFTLQGEGYTGLNLYLNEGFGPALGI